MAISAALIGFKRVYGFDRDPEAIRVSQENALFNELPLDYVEFSQAGLEDGLQGRHADLLLANIQADVLKIHANGILQAMTSGGMLCLSGILLKELATVRAYFEKHAQALFRQPLSIDTRCEGEWADLALAMP